MLEIYVSGQVAIIDVQSDQTFIQYNSKEHFSQLNIFPQEAKGKLFLFFCGVKSHREEQKQKWMNLQINSFRSVKCERMETAISIKQKKKEKHDTSTSLLT